MADIVVEITSPEYATAIADLVNLSVIPLHPGTTDPALARWYHLDVPVDRDADELAHHLLRNPYVEAAYVKPPEAAP